MAFVIDMRLYQLVQYALRGVISSNQITYNDWKSSWSSGAIAVVCAKVGRCTKMGIDRTLHHAGEYLIEILTGASCPRWVL